MLASMADLLATAQGDLTVLAQNVTSAQADMAQGTSDAAAGLAASLVAEAQAVAAALASAQAGNAADVASAATQFAVSSKAATDQRTSDQATISSQISGMQQSIANTKADNTKADNTKADNVKAQAASAKQTQAALDNATKLKADIKVQKNQNQLNAYTQAGAVQTIQGTLLNQVISGVGNIWQNLNLSTIPAQLANSLKAQVEQIAATHKQLTELDQNNGISGMQLQYMAIGGTLADIVGLRAISGAISGADPYTLQPWGKWERLYNGVNGAITLVQTATGISRVLGSLAGSCTGYLGGVCFVGDTEVATDWNDGMIAVLISDPVADGTEMNWIFIGFGIVIVGTLTRKRKTEEEDELQPLAKRRSPKPSSPNEPLPLPLLVPFNIYPNGIMWP